MSVDAPAARGGSPQCGAEDGVAVKGSGAGSCRAQIPLRQRSAVLLRTDGGRQRRLRPPACVTHQCAEIETRFHPSHFFKRLRRSEQMERAIKLERGVSTGKTIFFRKGVKLRNLLLIPFHEDGNFLLEEKKNTQLALSSSKFLRFSLIRV